MISEHMPRPGIFAALLLLSLTGCDAKPDKPPISGSTAAATAPGSQVAVPAPAPARSLTLTLEEAAVFNIRLAKAMDDAPDYSIALRNIQGLTGGVLGVTAKKLQNEYEQNAAAADQRYRGNTVLISGNVNAVHGSGTRYHVRFKSGRDASGTPRSEMAEGYAAFLARLDPGQRITLACKGAGTLMGDATLSDCVPAYAYARTKVADLLRRVSVPDLIATPGWLRQEVILAVAFASELPNNSACATSDFFNDECLALVRSIGSNYADKGSDAIPHMTAAAFKKLGIESW